MRPWYHRVFKQLSQSSPFSPITPSPNLSLQTPPPPHHRTGNEALDVDRLAVHGYSYNPCLTPLPNVLCVAATDADDAVAAYSNYGAKAVGLAAPGTGILSTCAGGGYCAMTGTSMSTPLVSAGAALVLSVLGATDGNYYRGAQARELLQSQGDAVAGLSAITASGMRLNLNRALARAASAAAAVLPGRPLEPLPGFSAGDQALIAKGMAETYYRGYAPSSLPLSISGLTALDIGVKVRLGPVCHSPSRPHRVPAAGAYARHALAVACNGVRSRESLSPCLASCCPLLRSPALFPLDF